MRNQIRFRRVMIFILLALNPAYKFCIAELRVQDDKFFEEQIRPILSMHCQQCHGAKKAESGLRLDSRKGILQGGESGPAVVPGHADQSRLLLMVRNAGDVQMPPAGKLDSASIDALARWIDEGAFWPGNDSSATTTAIRTGGITEEDKRWWSLLPVTSGPIPNAVGVDMKEYVDPIDAFLALRQQEAGISPVPIIGKEKLLRRVTLDLTGLLPTVAELDAYLADHSNDAFSKVVERLLASPRYGECWGRHWLDLVRYADTSGFSSDHPIPQARASAH